MRAKVTINLDTQDPIEAEILDMLAGIGSTHRRQERLRSFLKGGYNLLYKNMSADRAMAEAFDKQDVALILALFGKGNSDAGSGVVSSPVPRVADDRPPDEPRRTEEPVRAQPTVATHTIAPQAPVRRYVEIEPVLDSNMPESPEKPELVDFDPNLLELEKNETPDVPVKEQEYVFVDPLKRLFNN